MKINKILISIILSTTLYQSLYALDIAPLVESTIEIDSKDKMLSAKGVDNAVDDVYDDQDVSQIKLNEAQMHEAKVWDLTHEEEKRYIALMDNRAKSYYKGIKHTPIDVLGINARNDSERNRYANIAAKQEMLRVAKELAWNTAFYQQTKVVSNNKPVIADFDTSKYSPQNHNQYVLSDNDILHLFVKKDDASLTLVSPLLDAIKKTSSSKLIIYIIDADNDDAQLWANKNGLPLELVQQQRIIIKVGSDSFEAMELNKNKTPLLLLARKGQSKIISFGGRNA